MNPFRTMPYPSSGATSYRYADGVLVAEEPNDPAPQSAVPEPAAPAQSATQKKPARRKEK